MPRRRTESWASGSSIVSQFQRQSGGGGVGGGGGGGATPAAELPVYADVDGAEEITISHHFKSRYVTVTVYTEEGYILPQSRVLEIECKEYATRIVFHAAFTGVVKLSV